jgi:outer membrane receptor protein involved in Fe transport
VLGGGNANAARGDVSTVSLRGLGQGNTLLLLNGRRVVMHPTTQTDADVPVFGFNVNAIPVGGLERVEVLRDGAAALYGSDAVAGVINNVLKSDFRGASLDAQYGSAEGTNVREFQLNGTVGFDFAEGRGNISMFGGYTDRTKLYASDQAYTASNDRLGYVVGTPFEGNPSFDGRSSTSAWGGFQTPTSFGTVRSDGVALTSASGTFHIQPTSSAGCAYVMGATGTCIDDGAVTGTADRNIRMDTPMTFPHTTTLSGIKRLNLFSFINYDISDGISFFGELGFYTAKSRGNIASPSPLASTPITIPANAYYNPFGPVGSPNRLPGLNIPDEGLPVTIRNYNIVDAGMREVVVTNYQYRFLAGLQGSIGNWRWESAGLYSWATAKDTSDGVSNALFQQALARTTPDAYNPFNGADPANPTFGDATPNSQSIIDSFLIKNTRKNKTTLALWDLKLSNAQLFDLPAGPIGIAAGVEFRRETYKDDRDQRQGGDVTYSDMVTGITYGSDLMGHSPRPDVSGKRNVWSAYAELAVPVIGPDMNIPLVRSVDVQLAGRYERYSDVGSVAKPKIAGSWDVIGGLRLRASWSQGFRAPNLEQVNIGVQEGSTGGTDYVLCEADLRAGRISSFSECARGISIVRLSSGNKDLKPEESESFSYGVVFEPNFIPDRFGDITITVDRWQIKQKGVVGVLDRQNAVTQDYLLRLQGSSSPFVIRAAPTADDVAVVAGTGLAPAGEILYVQAQYSNLLPITVEGIDFNFNYRRKDTGFGEINFNFNAAKLLKYYRSPDAVLQSILDGQAAGEINAAVPITGGGDTVRQDGRPRWRFSATATWSSGPVTVGAFTNYIGSVDEIAVVDANNNPWVVKSQLTTNLFVQYKFTGNGPIDGTSVQLGVRNLTDENPPLSSGGYLASLYQPQGRYWYASIRKSF